MVSLAVGLCIRMQGNRGNRWSFTHIVGIVGVRAHFPERLINKARRSLLPANLLSASIAGEPRLAHAGEYEACVRCAVRRRDELVDKYCTGAGSRL